MCIISTFLCFALVPEIGTENRGFSLVLVPNTEILVPWQHYTEVEQNTFISLECQI